MDVPKHLIKNPDHLINFNNINVLADSDNWRKLLIKETLLIQNQKLSLNIDQIRSLYTVFIEYVIKFVLFLLMT